MPANTFVPMGISDADGSEFYKNAGTDGKGYYSIADADFEANVKAAKDILAKYYDFK